jgi:hypothetical protein
MANPLFAVVEFSADSAVAVISTKWITACQQFCLWPTSAGPSISTLVKKHATPEVTWKIYTCKVLKLLGKSRVV